LTVVALSIDAFSRKLSTSDPTPGGGSAAAAVGAMGASLVRMVAQLTAGSPKFADVAERATELGARAERLMEDLLLDVDEDVTAFDGVSAAMKMPKSTDGEKSSRTNAIQSALRAAADPPMRVVEASLETCKLAAELVDIGNPNAASDVGCAALFASAAARGAALNVAINAKSLKDREAAHTYTERLRVALAQVDLLAEVVLGKVQSFVRPQS
jgi:methenyltetrahydrofolate cyclohydrolase